MDEKFRNCVDFFTHLNEFKNKIITKLDKVIPEENIKKIQTINSTTAKLFEQTKVSSEKNEYNTILYFYNLCYLSKKLSDIFQYYYKFKSYDEYNTNLGVSFAEKIKNEVSDLNIQHIKFIEKDLSIDNNIYSSLNITNILHNLLKLSTDETLKLKYFYKFIAYLAKRLELDNSNEINIDTKYGVVKYETFEEKQIVCNFILERIKCKILEGEPSKTLFNKLVYYSDNDELARSIINDKQHGIIIIDMQYNKNNSINYNIEKLLDLVIVGEQGINPEMLKTFETITIFPYGGDNGSKDARNGDFKNMEKIKDTNYILTNIGSKLRVMSYKNEIIIKKVYLLDIFHSYDVIDLETKFVNEKFPEVEEKGKFELKYEEYMTKNDLLRLDTIKLKLINNLKFQVTFKSKSEFENYLSSTELVNSLHESLMKLFNDEIKVKIDDVKNMDEIYSSYLVSIISVKKKFMDKMLDFYSEVKLTDTAFKSLNQNTFYVRDFISKLIDKSMNEVVSNKNNFYEDMLKKLFILS